MDVTYLSALGQIEGWRIQNLTLTITQGNEEKKRDKYWLHSPTHDEAQHEDDEKERELRTPWKDGEH